MNRRDWIKSGLAVAGVPLWSASLFAGGEAASEKPALTLWQLPNQTMSQMESYILLTDSDQLVVIDGGTVGDTEYLLERIREIHPDGRVDYWLLTHIHLDHARALATILTRYPDALKIGQVYCDFPTAEWVKRFEEGHKLSSEEHIKAWLIRVAQNEAKRVFRKNRRCDTSSLGEWVGEAFSDDLEKKELFLSLT